MGITLASRRSAPPAAVGRWASSSLTTSSARRRASSTTTYDLPTPLATRAATAVDLSERVSRDAVRRVVEAQEVERARLARELHDETGQALTSILLGLKSLEERVETDDGGAGFAELRELVVATLQDVRRLAVELRPAALDDFGLVPALERLRDSVFEQSQISVKVRSDLDDRQRLPPETETALYRIVQEALTNVLKHAGATRVMVRLRLHERFVELVIQDDGAGFDQIWFATAVSGSWGCENGSRSSVVGWRSIRAMAPGRC